MLADEWIYTNYDGWVRSKAAYLDWVEAVFEPVAFVGPYDLEVRCYGDLALVLVFEHRVGRLPDGSLAVRFTGQWIERDGRW